MTRKVEYLLTAILCSTLVFIPNTVTGATTASPPRNLSCYDCSETFKFFWDPFTPCQSNLSSIPITKCHEQDTYCKVERTTVKGMTISISRSCSEDCYYGCRAYGYGITQLRCTSCCIGYACNTDNSGDRISSSYKTLTLLTLFVYFSLTLCNR